MFSTVHPLRHVLALACLIGGVWSTTSAAEGFALQDIAGKHLDVLLDGKLAARYMYEYDTSSKEQTTVTFKPYLHVFDAAGTAAITKGPGGQFPHHRGLFIGWNKVGHGGRSLDLWHMNGTAIIHEKFTAQEAGTDQARIVAAITWTALKPQNTTVLNEERTYTFRRSPAGRFTVEQQSRLTAGNGEVVLDGDPEHAGVQFRPAETIVVAETVYVFPREKVDTGKDRDYPWVGESFTVPSGRQSVVLLNHPGNPTGTRFSAYRNYGRFGAFPVTTIAAGATTTFTYRFLIADGEMPAAEKIQKEWDGFAGVEKPSAVPPVTVKKVDPPKEKKDEGK